MGICVWGGGDIDDEDGAGVGLRAGLGVGDRLEIGFEIDEGGGVGAILRVEVTAGKEPKKTEENPLNMSAPPTMAMITIIPAIMPLNVMHLY